MLEVEGWNPFERQCDNIKKKIGPELDEMLSVRSCTLRKRSIEMYRCVLKFFKLWCEAKGYNTLRSDQFTHLQALEYVDYLKRERKYSSKTCNDTVGYLKTLFFMLVERDIIKSNPFCKIKKSKEEKGKNVAFTPEEIDKVIKYMKIHNERLYYATQFVRYAFIRRTELMYLKVHHISIENQTITIPSEVSKTGKQDSITIPRSLEKVIKEWPL